MGLINAQNADAGRPCEETNIVRGYYRVQFWNSCTDVRERLRVNDGGVASGTCLMGVKRHGASLHADMCQPSDIN